MGKLSYEKYEEFVEYLRREGYENEIPTKILRRKAAKFFNLSTPWWVNNVLRALSDFGFIKPSGNNTFKIVAVEE